MSAQKRGKRKPQAADGEPVRQFRESSYSGTVKPEKIEVGFVTAEVLLRDSKHSDAPVLRFTTEEWEAFVAGVRAGDFDLS